MTDDQRTAAAAPQPCLDGFEDDYDFLATAEELSESEEFEEFWGEDVYDDFDDDEYDHEESL